jgi:hypothetical protein
MKNALVAMLILIVFSPSGNKTHLLNALSHAITLCGGKKAAF